MVTKDVDEKKSKKAPSTGMNAKLIATIALGVIALVFAVLYFVPSIASPSKPKIEYEMIAREQIISAAYKVYGNEKLGLWLSKTVAKNTGNVPLYNVVLHYQIDGYPSSESESNTYPVLLPGSTIVDLYYPMIPQDVTKLTSTTSSKIKLSITYSETPEGTQKEKKDSKSIDILGGNDIVYTSIPADESTGSFADVFDNYPLVAAWITPNDKVVTQYADMGNKLAGGAGASLSDEDALKSLAGMWQLSIINNIQYKTEGSAIGVSVFSQHLKYPRDVIRDKIGTCIDTAIFFATLAETQGLRPYIMLMTGHAFPVIELPISKNLIPIESTQLNNDATFEEALQSGLESWNGAMNGPHILIDIKSLQDAGISGPDLEDLPAGVLTDWGITSGTVATGGGGTTQGGESPVYSHSSAPAWSVGYPSGWSTTPSSNKVDFASSQFGVASFDVVWYSGWTRSVMQNAVESSMSNVGSVTKNSEGHGTVSGVSATTTEYTIDAGGFTYLAKARYFEYQNNGFALLCEYLEDSASTEQTNCNNMLQTFTLG